MTERRLTPEDEARLRRAGTETPEYCGGVTEVFAELDAVREELRMEGAAKRSAIEAGDAVADQYLARAEAAERAIAAAITRAEVAERALDEVRANLGAPREDCAPMARIRSAIASARGTAGTRFDLAAFFDAKAEWSLTTFGPGDKYTGVVAHIRKELAEIEADPADLEEWIDVVQLAMDGAFRSAGANGDRFVAALVAKQEKNLTRTWQTGADGVAEHVRGTAGVPHTRAVEQRELLLARIGVGTGAIAWDADRENAVAFGCNVLGRLWAIAAKLGYPDVTSLVEASRTSEEAAALVDTHTRAGEDPRAQLAALREAAAWYLEQRELWVRDYAKHTDGQATTMREAYTALTDLVAATAKAAETWTREVEARLWERAAAIVNAEMQSEAVARDRAYASGRKDVGSHRQAGVEALEQALTRLRTEATKRTPPEGTT